MLCVGHHHSSTTARPADSTAASGLRILLRRGREACVASNNLVRYVLRNTTLGERARGSRTVDVARVKAADVALPRPGPLGSASDEELDVLDVPFGAGYVDDAVIAHHDDLRDRPGCRFRLPHRSEGSHVRSRPVIAATTRASRYREQSQRRHDRQSGSSPHRAADLASFSRLPGRTTRTPNS